jgi:outer membrane protein assembly factor BamD
MVGGDNKTTGARLSRWRPARPVGASVAVLSAMLGLAALLPLAGCSSFGTETSSLDHPEPAEKMFADADKLLNNGSYKDAAEKYEDVERNYPFSNDPAKPYARRSLVLAAFAYYKAGDYDNAIAAGGRFISLHAGSGDAALAHHIVAMSYFDQMQDSLRDQTFTARAVEWFSREIRQFPDSKFATEDANRLRIAKDTLAASEMNVGRYYLSKHNYLAAINRFKTVVTEHQTTRHVEEALERLTECYFALGIKPEAQNAAAILGHNYPDSPWYKDAYALLKTDGLEPRADSGSWLSKSWKKTVATLTGGTG